MKRRLNESEMILKLQREDARVHEGEELLRGDVLR